MKEHQALQAASSQPIPLPQPPLLMQAFNVTSPDDFLLETMKKIRPSDLEEALLLLPFDSVCTVLHTLPVLVARGDHTEVVCKIAMFLLKLHHAPIVANHALANSLKQLQKLVFDKVRELRVSFFLLFRIGIDFSFLRIWLVLICTVCNLSSGKSSRLKGFNCLEMLQLRNEKERRRGDKGRRSSGQLWC